jgi:hypothetical protein
MQERTLVIFGRLKCLGWDLVVGWEEPAESPDAKPVLVTQTLTVLLRSQLPDGTEYLCKTQGDTPEILIVTHYGLGQLGKVRWG